MFYVLDMGRSLRIDQEDIGPRRFAAHLNRLQVGWLRSIFNSAISQKISENVIISNLQLAEQLAKVDFGWGVQEFNQNFDRVTFPSNLQRLP